MRIYFIRHGQTEHALNGLAQSANSPLSKTGKDQAVSLAKRLSKINFDLILSSPFARAQETAEIISKQLQTPVEVHDFLHEIKKPSILELKESNNEQTREIQKQILDNLGKTGWHHSDEENYDEVKKRGEETIAYIKAQKKNNILVVSHGNFIKMIVSLLLFGENITPDRFRDVLEFFGMTNTGISIIEDTPFHHGWKLIAWNDTSHLD